MKANVLSTQKMLNTWAIVLIIWALYRTYFKTSLPLWVDEIIIKPTIFLVPIYYYISKYEKGNFLEKIDLKNCNIKKGIVTGLIFGGIFFLIGFIVQYFKQGQVNFLKTIPITQIVYISIIAFASSVSEEILSRGFVLKRLFAQSKSYIHSIFFSSFLFFFLHIPILFSNPNLYGIQLIQVMISDILLSFAVSYIYLENKNLISPILVHAFYNLSLYFLVA